MSLTASSYRDTGESTDWKNDSVQKKQFGMKPDGNNQEGNRLIGLNRQTGLVERRTRRIKYTLILAMPPKSMILFLGFSIKPRNISCSITNFGRMD
jgi:hypothetical protein